MMKESTFWEYWEEHKEWLLKTCGCFHENRRFRYASTNCESQFEGLEWWWWWQARLSQEVYQGIYQDGEWKSMHSIHGLVHILDWGEDSQLQLLSPHRRCYAKRECTISNGVSAGIPAWLIHLHQLQNNPRTEWCISSRVRKSIVIVDESGQAKSPHFPGEGADYPVYEQQSGDNHHRRYGLRQKHSSSSIPNFRGMEAHCLHPAATASHD